jgi:hypothetical protein
MMVFWNKTIIAHFQHHRATNRPVNNNGGIRKGATCRVLKQPGTGLIIANLSRLDHIRGRALM